MTGLEPRPSFSMRNRQGWPSATMLSGVWVGAGRGGRCPSFIVRSR